MMNGGSLERVVEAGVRISELRKQLEELEEQIRTEESALVKLLGGQKNGVAALLHSFEGSGVEPTRGGPFFSSRGATERSGASRSKSRGSRAPNAPVASQGKGTIMEGIVELLESRPGESLGVADVAALLNAKPTSIATMLKRLLIKGRITRPETGRYQAA